MIGKEVANVEIIHKLTMDLETKDPTKWLEIPQGEVNTRKIRFLLTADGIPWQVPEGAVVLIRFRKPDGTEGEYDTLPDGGPAWTAEEDTLTISLAPQVLTAAGSVFLYASIRKNTQVLNTFVVELRVRAAEDGEAHSKIDASEDYFYMTRVIPGPESASKGQFLCVAAVDEAGRVIRVKGVNAVTGGSGVYVGSGQMPENCNVQIDPSGETVSVKDAVDAYLKDNPPAGGGTSSGITEADKQELVLRVLAALPNGDEVAY